MKYIDTKADFVQTWACKECENDMSVNMFIRSPKKGILLECDDCERQVTVEGEQRQTLV